MPSSEHGHDVKTLNSLLTTVVDSVDGFEKANDVAEGHRFKQIFEEIATERRALAREFETEIRRLGGTPDEKGSVLASAHRLMIKLREAFSSGDAAVVAEAERGEDYIKNAFEKAERDENLSTEARTFIARAATRVKQGHDRIATLKHALNA